MGGQQDPAQRSRYLALAIELSEPEALHEQATRHEAAGEYEQALRLYERAADEHLSPPPAAWLRLGVLFAAGLGTARDLAAARYRLEEVILRWPDEPEAAAARRELDRLGRE